MNANPSSHLNHRAREIFRRIVESYLETGDPVGSRYLSKHLNAPLSPASVRNVMADLEDLGLIYAPHTSAGRLPTEQGLRFFVDAMMEFGDLTGDERNDIEAQIKAKSANLTLDSVLHDASQTLSNLSQGAAFVAVSKADVAIKHMEFVRLDARQALAIFVGEDGAVENRIITLPMGLPTSALVEASNWLNTHMRGRKLAEVKAAVEGLRTHHQRELDELTQRVIEAGFASWSGQEQDKTLIVHGQSHLLDQLTAIEDLERIRHLFEDLERKRSILELLEGSDQAEGVRIFIGAENRLFSLTGSSLITAPFHDSQQKIVGVLGIIGPTRLNYARIVPMVDYTAKILTRYMEG